MDDVNKSAAVRSILSVELAAQGCGISAHDSEAGSECVYDATAEVVLERDPEPGLALPGTSVDDAGHTYEIE